MTRQNVYCVCGGIGFPLGTASTKRITMIGRSLVCCGVAFHVFHIGPSPFGTNGARTGSTGDIGYDYLGPRVRWSGRYVVRTVCYVLGGLELILKLWGRRKKGVVYCYYQGNGMNLWTLLVCSILKIPVIQEASEWWPGTEYESGFTRWMYRAIMFRISKGSLPISKTIAQRIGKVRTASHRMCPVPVLIDPEEYVPGGWDRTAMPSAPVLVWCGMVEGYRRDVLFLIDALALMESAEGERAILAIVGPCGGAMNEALRSYAEANQIDPKRIMVTGYVTEEELRDWCTKAHALLMPLWNDDRSRTRFPTKLGQYLAARRPVVTAAVGDVKDLLPADGAFFYEPGNPRSLADALEQILADPRDVEHRIRRATETALPLVDYRMHGPAIRRLIGEVSKP